MRENGCHWSQPRVAIWSGMTEATVVPRIGFILTTSTTARGSRGHGRLLALPSVLGSELGRGGERVIGAEMQDSSGETAQALEPPRAGLGCNPSPTAMQPTDPGKQPGLFQLWMEVITASTLQFGSERQSCA